MTQDRRCLDLINDSTTMIMSPFDIDIRSEIKTKAQCVTLILAYMQVSSLQCTLNSLKSGDVYMRHWIWSSLVQAMACLVPSHYLNLCWLATAEWNPLFSALQWCHNERDGVSNHQPHDCLLNRLFRRRSKKTSKLRVTNLCTGNSPVNSPHKGLVTRKCFHLMTSSW